METHHPPQFSSWLAFDQDVWNAFAIDRVWVCRFVVACTGLNVLGKLIGVLVLDGVTFDAHVGVATLVVFGIGLLWKKLRDSLRLVLLFSLLWTIANVVSTAALLQFVWNDGESFAYAFGTTKGEDKQLTSAGIRVELLPFNVVLTLAAMGVPTKFCLPIGLVQFACQVTAVFVLVIHAEDTDVTDLVSIAGTHLYSALLTVFFAWTVEKHEFKARDSLALLRHTLRQWIHQKDIDRTTRNRIVGYIFHEVRNPLNNITLATDLLLDRFHQALAKSPTNGDNNSNNNNNDDNKQEISELLDTISKAADSACHVLNDALSLQKLEAGTFEFVKQPFSLMRFFTQAVRVATPQMMQKDIKFETQIDAPLQQASVYGDFNRLQQVVTNFLSNAYKFTPNSGTVCLRITHEGDRFSGDSSKLITIRVSVEDSGAGIASSDHNRVFQAWSQIRASDLQQGQGSGLGLSLCKAFVEVGHNGKIGFTSEIGRGSVFYFEIDFQVFEKASESPGLSARRLPHATNTKTKTPSPAQRNRHSKQTTENDPMKRSSSNVQSRNITSLARVFFPRFATNDATMLHEGSGSERAKTDTATAVTTATAATVGEDDVHESHATELVPLRANALLRSNTNVPDATKDVLVVDDSLVTRKLLCKILESLDVSYDTSENGKQAVECILTRSCKYRLILMDKEMPVMDGFEATRALRAGGYDLPVIGLTGNAMDDQVAEFISAGANNVLSKPIKRDVLVRLLHQHSVEVSAQFTAPKASLSPVSRTPHTAPHNTKVVADSADFFALS